MSTDKAQKDRDAVIKKIESFDEPYRQIGHQIHEKILETQPHLKPRLWYGIPGYATARSKPVLIFFRLDDAVMSFGISEKATTEREAESLLKPSAWFIDEMNEATLERIAQLVNTAI